MNRKNKTEGKRLFQIAHTNIHSVLTQDKPLYQKIIALEGTLMGLDYGIESFSNYSNFKELPLDKAMRKDIIKNMKNHTDSMFKNISILEEKLLKD